jgi:hypothetical protein
MTKPDAQLLETLERLGIEPGDATVFGPEERPRRRFAELESHELLRWVRLLGPDSPDALVAEVRKRGLLPEPELRSFLGSKFNKTDTDAA